MRLVAERAGRQPRHAADVAGRERDLEAVRARVRQPVHAVRPEIVILPLLAVGDHRRAGGLESLDGVPNGLIENGIQHRIVGVAQSLNGLHQLTWPRNATNWLRRN